MNRFEYKLIELGRGVATTVDRLSQHLDALNQAGAEGWEVVSCVQGGVTAPFNSPFVTYVLKRKLP